MNYALVENGVVTNIIWLYSGNAEDFPNAVPLEDRPARIGDAYANGVFSRNGVPVQTPLEEAVSLMSGAEQRMDQIEAALVELAGMIAGGGA